MTVADSQSLPRMEDYVETIGTARYVSKLDLLKGSAADASAADGARQRSLRLLPQIIFLKCMVMAFGMCNAPATFQRLVSSVLSGMSNCNAYLDDCVHNDFPRSCEYVA